MHFGLLAQSNLQHNKMVIKGQKIWNPKSLALNEEL